MKNYLLLIILFSFLNDGFSQQVVTNINSYEELTEWQSNFKNPEQVAFVWGHYEGWSKYWPDYKNVCIGILNSQIFSKITSRLEFSLFNSSIIISQPFKEPINFHTELKKGDVIKLKIRMYKNCKYVNDEIFFLIEEMF